MHAHLHIAAGANRSFNQGALNRVHRPQIRRGANLAICRAGIECTAEIGGQAQVDVAIGRSRGQRRLPLAELNIDIAIGCDEKPLISQLQ